MITLPLADEARYIVSACISEWQKDKKQIITFLKTGVGTRSLNGAKYIAFVTGFISSESLIIA